MLLESGVFHVTMDGRSWCATVMTLCCFDVIDHTVELLQYYYNANYTYLKLLQYFSGIYYIQERLCPAAKGSRRQQKEPTREEDLIC